jgi:hypothetical protein
MKKSVEQRIVEHTTVNSNTECWECDFALGGGGYPVIRINGKNVYVHRFIFSIYREDPGDLCVCHECDNPICWHPWHLFKGTHKDNMEDMSKKGRAAIGDENGSRLYPERIPKGDNHYSRTHPEKMARGDRHGSKTHPERTPRGDDHYSRIHPEKMSRGEQHSRIMREVTPKGEYHYMAILTEDLVREILSYKQQGCRPIDIATFMKLNKSTVKNVVNGHRWKHIERVI